MKKEESHLWGFFKVEREHSLFFCILSGDAWYFFFLSKGLL